MPKVSEHGSGYLKPHMVKNGDRLKVLDSGRYVPPEETGFSKEVFHLRVHLPNGQKVTANINPTSQGEIAKDYGDNTEGWVGRELRVEVVRGKTPRGIQDILYFYPVESKPSSTRLE